MKTETIIIKVDLDCCRCHSKIKKVLDRIKEKREFVIDDIEYDEKKNRVIVKGPFDPHRLADKLCCKACKIIKEIEIVEPPPPGSPKKGKDNPPPDETVKVDQPSGKTVEVETPPPQVVKVPYPCPYPYPFPVWPSDCRCHHGHGGCHCCSCGKQAPPAPAPTPQPPQYIIIPQYPPYPCGGYNIVCEDDPSYACSIM